MLGLESQRATEIKAMTPSLEDVPSCSTRSSQDYLPKLGSTAVRGAARGRATDTSALTCVS